MPNKNISQIDIMPKDSYNKELIDNVHPLEHENISPKGKYNLVVIGGGTAGLVSAIGAASLTARVALIEEKFLGGDCLNYGCVPSKALLRPAHFLNEINKGQNMGVNTLKESPFDFSLMMQQMRRIRAHISHNDSVQRLKNFGVDVFLGHAEFLNEHTILVGDKKLVFKKAIIATGSRPRKLIIPGSETVDVLTNESLFSLTKLPQKLVIVGAGPIGCEMGQAFNSFGSSVHIVEKGNTILPKDEPEAANLVMEQLTKEGVNFHFASTIKELKKEGEEKALVIEEGGNVQTLTANEILVAIGRTPNIEGLHLEKAGISVKQFGVVVNDYLQTTNPNIFAAGDICSRFQFTHTAEAMAKIAVENSLFFGRKKVSNLLIPWCTYTNPECAHIGFSHKQAVQKGYKVKTLNIPLNSIDRALLNRHETGFLRIHYNEKSKGIILGATAVCRNAGEIIDALSIVMTNNIPLSKLNNTIFCYPTEMEVLKHAAKAYNKTRLTKTIKMLLSKFFKLRRI